MTEDEKQKIKDYQKQYIEDKKQNIKEYYINNKELILENAKNKYKSLTEDGKSFNRRQKTKNERITKRI